MIRKSIQINPTTLAITLPSKWVKSHNVGKGEEISIDEERGKLVVSPPKEAKPIKKSAHLELKSEYRQYIKIVITNAYRLGYDVLELGFRTEKQFDLIKDVVANQTIGYEITEKKGNRCKIESITEPPEDKVDVLLKKIFFTIKDVSGTILDFLNNNSELDLKYLKSQRFDLDQYIYFCKRNISKTRFEEKSYLKWTMLSYLLLVEHALFRLVNYFVKNKVKPSTKFISVYEKIHILFSDYFDSYFKKDINEFSKIYEEAEKLLYNDFEELFKKGKEGGAIYQMAQILRHTALCCFPSTGIYIIFQK